jgi:uncharacterized protein YcbX
MSGTRVGRVVALWRYPVKSMAAEPLERCEVSWHGLAGDRRWAFVRGDQVRSGFPWLTIRERDDLIHHRPRFVDPESVETSATVVRTPGGDEFDVTDPDLAVRLGDVRVIKQNRGVFDTMPLSLITTQSVAGLSALVGRELEVQRFRPNLLVDARDGAAFPEDAWVGSVLEVGGVRMRVDQRDKRCVVVTVDPQTTERDPIVLRAIARERQTCLGVYGTTVTPGTLSIGDEVTLVAGA